MDFKTPYIKLPLPVNYDSKDADFFVKINDWKKNDDSSKIVKNVKVTYEGYFMQNFKLHPDSFFGKQNYNLGLKERLKLYLSSSNENIKLGTWCTDPWGNGYYHWIVDTLQRYYSIYEMNSEITLLLPESYKSLGFVTESLKSLKIKHKWVGKNEVVKVESLYLPAFIKPRGTCNPKYISTLANKLRQMPFIYSTPKKMVYISRQKALRRKIQNEDEVIDLMHKHNIDVLYMEEISWVDQMQIMANANVLISLHGAGLTNMVIMPKNSKVLEIRMDTGFNQVCYYELAGSLGHYYYYNKARPYSENDSPGYGNCIVDIQKLETIIKNF